MQHGLHIRSYRSGACPVYQISVPGQLLLPRRSDATRLLCDTHMSSLHGEDVFCDMEVPAIVLDGLGPNLVQSSVHSSSSGMDVAGEDLDMGSAVVSTSDMPDMPRLFEIIDLTAKDTM